MLSVWMILMWGCGDKSETDTALESGDTVTDADTNTDGSSQGSDTDTDSSTGGDPDADPNVDADGDGVVGSEDCDDSDPYTYPDAMEFPGDGVDQNCDGVDPLLKEARPLNNPSFDLDDGGVPVDWDGFGDGYAWQQDGSEIVTPAGSTGQIFDARSGNGSLKIWGDYGTSPFGNGESIVSQEILPNGTWIWTETNFWVDGWVMVHDSNPLQADAAYSLGIRCVKEFYGSKSVVGEAFSTPVTTVDSTNTWMRVWSEIVCPGETSLLEVVVRFEQPTTGADSPDHGTVFVDDIAFGIVE